MKRMVFLVSGFLLSTALIFSQDAAPAAPAAPAPIGEFHNSLYGVFYPAVAIGSNAPVSAWGPSFYSYPKGYTGTNYSGGVYNDWKFSFTAKDYGFVADDHFNQDGFSTILYSIAAWFKFTDMAKLTFGKINNGEYNEFSQLAGDQLVSKFFNQEYGVLGQVFPSSALSIGLAYYVPGTSLSTSTTSLASAPAIDFGDNFGLAASYKVSESSLVHAFYKAIGNGTTDARYLDIGGNTTPTKEWYLSAEYLYDFSATGSQSASVNNVYAGVKYTGISNVAITVDENLSSGSAAGGSSNTYNYLEGAVEYDPPSTPWGIGLQLGYDSGIANSASAWQGNALAGGFDDFTSSIGGAEIYPYAQYNFDHGSFVKAGFLYLTGGIAITGGGTTSSAWSVPVYYSASF